MKKQITNAGREASSSLNGGGRRRHRQFREIGQNVSEEAPGTLENLALLEVGPLLMVHNGNAVGCDGNHVQGG